MGRDVANEYFWPLWTPKTSAMSSAILAKRKKSLEPILSTLIKTIWMDYRPEEKYLEIFILF